MQIDLNKYIQAFVDLDRAAQADLPFDQLRLKLLSLCSKLGSAYEGTDSAAGFAQLALAGSQAQTRAWNQLCKPLYALGNLEPVISRLAGLSSARQTLLNQSQVEAASLTQQPLLKRGCCLVFAADNGVVSEGVSQAGPEVTAAVYQNIGAGQASIAILARDLGLDLVNVDLGVKDLGPKTSVSELGLSTCCQKLVDQISQLAGQDQAQPLSLDFVVRPEGTRNLKTQPALTKTELVQALAAGFILAGACQAAGYDFLVGGEMGIGNTTSSTALAAALLKLEPKQVCGRGAGLSNQGLEHKIQVINAALDRVSDLSDPLALLANLGGYDLAALVGLYLGAFCFGLPLILDGLISLAAAALAQTIQTKLQQVLVPSHHPREPAGQALLDHLGLAAPLHLDLALGEGAGALFYLPILRQAELIARSLPSFSQGQVDQYEDFSQQTSQQTIKDSCKHFEFPEDFFVPHGISLIYGGEKSGKSDFAERAAFALAQSVEKPLLYIATLYIGDDPENQARVQRHRDQRSGYGFINQEIYFDYQDRFVSLPQDHIILLDCLTNLLTNRLYQPQADQWLTSQDPDDLILTELVTALDQLATNSQHLFIVANDLHTSLGPANNQEMERFLRLHGKLLQALVKLDRTNLFELNFGLAKLIKSGSKPSA